MAQAPGAWDWAAAHVPSGLSEEQEEEKQAREAALTLPLALPLALPLPLPLALPLTRFALFNSLPEAAMHLGEGSAGTRHTMGIVSTPCWGRG